MGPLYVVPGDATAEQITESATFAARVEGCRCDVEITVSKIAPGAWHVQVAHDDWCPRLRAAQGRWN